MCIRDRHYPLTNHSIRFGRDRRILTPIIMPVAVMMGEYIGGLSKIGGTVFTTLGGAFALWITKEYILLYLSLIHISHRFFSCLEDFRLQKSKKQEKPWNTHERIGKNYI